MSNTPEFYDVSYYYTTHNGYNVTIAYARTTDRSQVVFGAAFCRPTDRFTKRMGRHIAESRMHTRPTALMLDPTMKRFDMHNFISERLQFTGYAPRHIEGRSSAHAA
jgi:hypothetical protein